MRAQHPPTHLSFLQPILTLSPAPSLLSKPRLSPQPFTPAPNKRLPFPPQTSLYQEPPPRPCSPVPAAEWPGPGPPGLPPRGPCHPHCCQTGTEGRQKTQVPLGKSKRPPSQRRPPMSRLCPWLQLGTQRNLGSLPASFHCGHHNTLLCFFTS